MSAFLWRRLRSPVAGLVVFALAGSALAIERKAPGAERKPPADRTTAAEAHYELGIFYHERMFSDLDQAIGEYEQAVKLKDNFAEAHYHLGLSYHTKAKLGVDDKALYRKALREYKLYLKYLPKGQLAEKARQNIKAVELRLR
ncbi:MAG: tetratricopeptide repeat protein [Candidatus Methylomirabilis oxyfera]|nr:tetratricopeptide repeat protein [Candidatus Methylomirabilis oxyfera]